VLGDRKYTDNASQTFRFLGTCLARNHDSQTPWTPLGSTGFPVRDVVAITSNASANVRVISATNRDLEAAIQEGNFRQDLYFLLNLVQSKLPQPRELRSNLLLLVNSLLKRRCTLVAKPGYRRKSVMRL